jgi:hypothetical protein
LFTGDAAWLGNLGFLGFLAYPRSRPTPDVMP